MTIFASRMSNWFIRSPYIVPGSIRLIVTVAVQAPVAAGHADRFRPSDGAICAFDAT